MLSKDDNELLCRVGPGTPMGNLMRQYWIPAARSDELPGPDCPPLRVRLLGENLIGFRTTSGRVGLVQNACPHRGASLFFGRNEEEGLRCVYHGWKFDCSGQCVDMPSEPAESNFKSKIKAIAYPCQERNGVVWVYMGARQEPPALPDMEANLLNPDPERISILKRNCNWMQGLEGELDTIHAAFLHWGADKPEDQPPGSFNRYMFSERSARFVVKDTEFGAAYGAYRPAEQDSYYWRIAYVMFPFYAMQPQGELGPEVKMNAYVPVDDEHTLQWEIMIRTDGQDRGRGKLPIIRAGTPQSSEQGGQFSRGARYLPHTTDWLGRFNIEQTMANDFLVDREAQRTGKSFTGIPGIRQQDMAVTESMGAIYDRTHEHLGTTDAMIIRSRRRWIKAAAALRDKGEVPPGVDDPTVYRQRSGETILPRTADWWDGSEHLRKLWAPGRAATSLRA
jgi:phthalate 4,5-dioxygenase oxygenase subunit